MSPKREKGSKLRCDSVGIGNFIAMGTGEVFLRSPGTGSNGRNNCFCLSSSALQTSAKNAACHLCDFHATATRPHATAQKLRMWKRPLIARGDHSWSPSSSETCAAKQVPKMLPNTFAGFLRDTRHTRHTYEHRIQYIVALYLFSLAYSQKSLWLTEHTNLTSRTQIIYFDHDRVLLLCLNSHEYILGTHHKSRDGPYP